MRFDVRQAFDRSETPREALARWNGEVGSLEAIEESSNFVYRFVRGGQRFYLRIASEKHRKREQLMAEVEFVRYLGRHGCAVAMPLESVNGELIERLAAGGAQYHAAVFEEAAGQTVKWGTHEQNRRVMGMLGRSLARIHAESKDYRGTVQRFHWDDGFLRYIGPQLPASQGDVKKEIDTVLEWAGKQAMTEENFGLIHGDPVPANFRISGERLTLFDFDDCCRHWYLFDLAIALRATERLDDSTRNAYLQAMLEGYRAHGAVEGDAVGMISWLFRLSSLLRYVHAIRSWDLINLTDEQEKMLEERVRIIMRPLEWR